MTGVQTCALPIYQFIGLVVTNYILKVGIEVILTPLTLFVVNWLKRAEQSDPFDRETNFNPFKA